MKFIQQILDRAGRIEVQDDQLIRGFEFENGDRVVGILPEELKGLYFILRESSANLEKKRNRIQTELIGLAAKRILDKTVDVEGELEKIKQEFLVAVDQNKTIECMFWSSVRRIFPEILREPMVGIRKGWKIVACILDKPEESEAPDVVVVELALPTNNCSPADSFSKN